jgi:hypothetical protein
MFNSQKANVNIITNKTKTYIQKRDKPGDIYHFDNNNLIGATLTAMIQ